MKKNILFFGVNKSSLDSGLKKKLNELSEIKDVKKIVCLPDLHFKQNMESPSSAAIATKKTIELKFSSASLNCGMGLVATSLTEKDISKKFMDSFFSDISPSLFRAVLNKLNLRKDKYSLNKNEVKKAALSGAEAVLSKYNLSKGMLKNMENNGKLNYIDIKKSELPEILPKEAFSPETLGFGSAFYGNHFLEIQVVDKIINNAMAKKWGIKKGQVVIMYHGGGGKVPYVLGRYFSYRKKGSRITKMKQFFRKLFFHFFKAKQLSFRKTWDYFFRKGFNPVPVDSPEGKRLLKIIQLSMNYGYAYRLATFARIRDKINSIFPNKKNKLSLIHDVSHNSIQPKVINGERLWIHRHNCSGAFYNKPIILSGYNNTSSYVCVGSDKLEKSLFSVDHGAGELIKQFYKKRISKINKNYFTVSYSHSFNSLNTKKIPHITNKGIKCLIDILEKEKILKPVAELRPLAGIKN